MKKTIILVMLLLTMMISDEYTITKGGQLILNKTITVPYTVIPGLYSFGTDTRAAYGGAASPKILHVNTLVAGVSNTDSTHGSFEWCLTQTYPRVVVFDVSGIIQGRDGTSGAPVIIRNPYITIAGQTAPDSIVYNGVLWTETHDVLIQHLAVRGRSTNNELDAIQVGSYLGPSYNIVIDHCSGTWGLDEQISVAASASTSNSLTNVTISNCIIAESIYPTHPTGSTNYGALGSDKMAHVLNLYAKNSMRNPLFGKWYTAAVYNNLVYNWRNSVVLLVGEIGSTEEACEMHFSYQGNHAIEGPDTTTSATSNQLLRINTSVDTTNQDVFLEIYMSDNIKYGSVHVSGYDVWDQPGNGYDKMNQAINNNGYVIKPASETRDYVLANVGPRPMSRDTVDARIIDEVINKSGRFIATVPSVPAEPKITFAFVPVSNPHNMYNSNYTNLEHQLHLLAAAVEPAK